MAITFNETDQWYSIANSSDMDLPNGDWCVGIWARIASLSGTLWEYLVSNNGYNATPAFNLYVAEGSGGWHYNIQSDNGTTTNGPISTNTPGADGLWRLLVVQRDTTASEFQLWWCTFGGTPSKQITMSDGGFDGLTGQGWEIGRRADGNADRYYGNEAAEFFKFNGALSQAEIAALGSGAMIWDLGYTPDVYISMRSAESTLVDLFGGNDATQNGSPTTVEHVPVLPGMLAPVTGEASTGAVTVSPGSADVALSALAGDVVLGSVTVGPGNADVALSALAGDVIFGETTATPNSANVALSAAIGAVMMGAIACTPRVAVLPTHTQGEYQIWVYAPEKSSGSPRFEPLGVISPQLFLWSFRYRVAANRVGSFTGTLDANSRFAEWFSQENTVIQIRRRVPGRNWRVENTYMLKYRNPVRSGDTWKLAIGEPDLNGLLDNANVVPSASSADGYVRLEGDADYVMKALVNSQMGAGAPTETQIPSLRTEGFSGAGADASVQGRYAEMVLELLQQASEQGGIDFWFEFDTDYILFRAGDYGTNRTVIANPAGPYVVFSPERGNMIDDSLMQDWRDAWRVVDVLGAGEGAEQEVETVAPGLLTIHPWSRRRRSVAARSIEPGDTLGFMTEGNRALDENRAKEDLRFSARQIPSCLYGVHYFVGDRVSTRYDGIEKDYLIRAVEVYLSGEGETINVDFEAV